MKYRTVKDIAKILENTKLPVNDWSLNTDGSYDIFFSRELTEEEISDINQIVDILELDPKLI
jgi:hypothetical protein